MALCPHYREKEYDRHANRVARILKNQNNKNITLEQQKKDFIQAVTEMARAAGHLPTLELH